MDYATTLYQILPEFRAIAMHYGEKTARRSGMPLINHIVEGCAVLEHLGLTGAAAPYCLHPLFQRDEDLLAAGTAYMAEARNPSAVFYALEYRRVANSYLSGRSSRPACFSLGYWPFVRHMLIADKVQNRKDFERYHLGRHPNSRRLQTYFLDWMDILGIGEELYQELVAVCDRATVAA